MKRPDKTNTLAGMFSDEKGEESTSYNVDDTGKVGKAMDELCVIEMRKSDMMRVGLLLKLGIGEVQSMFHEKMRTKSVSHRDTHAFAELVMIAEGLAHTAVEIGHDALAEAGFDIDDDELPIVVDMDCDRIHSAYEKLIGEQLEKGVDFNLEDMLKDMVNVSRPDKGELLH